MKLQGIFVAAATPFDYSGEIYKAKVEHNIGKWNRTSVSGYVFGDDAGEGPLLREPEKVQLWELAAKYAAPGKVLIADVSSEGVQVSDSLARQAAETGFHAVVCGVPAHDERATNAASIRQLYFRSVADRSPIPVLIRNSPRQAVSHLAPETVAALSNHPNITGVIETDPSRDVISGLEFQILTGSAQSLWKGFQNGASAAVLSLASAVPHACITLWEAFRTREEEAGLDWQQRILKPSLLVTEVYGVPGLKHAMEINGYYGGPPRLPYCPPGTAAKAEIEEAFRDLRG